jgi:hypothetical protein
MQRKARHRALKYRPFAPETRTFVSISASALPTLLVT